MTQNINQDKFLIFEKEYDVSDVINDGVKRLINAIKNFFTDNVFKYIKKEYAVQDSYIEEFKDALENFREILWEDKLYCHEEYYYFSSIVRMVYYLSNDKNSLLECTSLISELISIFFDVISLKNSIQIEEYNNIFQEFRFKFHDFKDVFYENYYVKSEHYDEEILNEMRRDLWELEEEIL